MFGTHGTVRNFERQRYANERAARASLRRRGIFQRQGAAVLLRYLLNHGEAKAGTLVTLGGHIRLEQAGTVLLGQSDAVVDHLDRYPIALRRHDSFDATLPALDLAIGVTHGLDRLARVLHEVGDGAGDEL